MLAPIQCYKPCHFLQKSLYSESDNSSNIWFQSFDHFILTFVVVVAGGGGGGGSGGSGGGDGKNGKNGMFIIVTKLTTKATKTISIYIQSTKVG